MLSLSLLYNVDSFVFIFFLIVQFLFSFGFRSCWCLDVIKHGRKIDIEKLKQYHDILASVANTAVYTMVYDIRVISIHFRWLFRPITFIFVSTFLLSASIQITKWKQQKYCILPIRKQVNGVIHFIVYNSDYLITEWISMELNPFFCSVFVSVFILKHAYSGLYVAVCNYHLIHS